MSDREAILERVHRAVARRTPHPGAYACPPGPRDWASFAARLRSVGGEPLGPVESDALSDALRRLCRAGPEVGRVVVSGPGVAEFGSGPWEPVPATTPPHALADVDVAILRGSIGVAENGAVALEGRCAPIRALPFLCQRLVLVLDAAAIVPDMHRAIARMPADATRHHHYTWISGPSKTADIEQTLVLGAHGPRSLAVIGVAPRI